MPKYVYTYFDARGRAEPARMLFAVAGVPFEDRRIKQEDWPALKPKTPIGSLPVLEVDGESIAQSLVIFRHLSRCFGLDGKTLLDKARIEEIVENLTEVKEAGFKVAFCQDEEEKKKLQESCMKTFDNVCNRIEKIISSNKSKDGWAVGEKMSFADIMLFEVFEGTLKQDPSALDKYPKIKACRQKAEANKNLKDYVSKREETPF
ncbi:glutathione S-transferase 1-like [Saccostrea echinata]|uniref:glutathione S-transferase 1-like n=1 Tax=Saccostrea echinata TaxID=191078 RepID=UPI002A801523|nr:glutathione S-transferase 1-like [Saccostrea echinata]